MRTHFGKKLTVNQNSIATKFDCNVTEEKSSSCIFLPGNNYNDSIIFD